MMGQTDLQLLQEFAARASDEAFAVLVQRHLDLVYSTALRQVRAPQLAEEIAQSVFIDLSKNAARLANSKIETLTPWLYQVARRTAIDVLRRESRRQLREKLAVELTDMHNHPSLWIQIEPLLDEAMDTLDAAERDALLLRFFDNKSLREVGQSVGASEDAAQKRVSRALDHLREFFSKRGVTVGAASLAAMLTANAIQSAPLGLSTTISATAATATAGALHTLALSGATKTIAMTTTQKLLVTAAITAIGGATLYQNYRAAQWREQARALQEQQAPLSEQLSQLRAERDESTNQLLALRRENEDLRRNAAELPKLRGEISQMRDDQRELARLKAGGAVSVGDPEIESAFKTWAMRASKLRQSLENAPTQKIPEIQYLSEKEWFDAIKGLKTLDSDEDFKKAFSNARNIAKGEFGRSLQTALKNYVDANNGELPQDLGQLKPFFKTPVDDSILERYKLLHTGKLADVPANDAYLVADIAPLIDEDNDATFKFSINGTNSHSGSPAEDAVKEAVAKFAAEHSDLLPTDQKQLMPYLTQPIDPARLQAMFGKVPPGVTTLRQLKASMR